MCCLTFKSCIENLPCHPSRRVSPCKPLFHIIRHLHTQSDPHLPAMAGNRDGDMTWCVAHQTPIPPPGSSLSPAPSVSPGIVDAINVSGIALTSFSCLVHSILDGARAASGIGLRGERFAGGAEAGIVHGLLQSIILPAKDVVCVLPVTSTVLISNLLPQQWKRLQVFFCWGGGG
jgi:hypothetical protein